jgi:hypothetical protein
MIQAASASTLQPPIERLRALLPQQLGRRLHSARELARRNREEEQGLLPTALPALDRLLAGGLPRGQLVELTGSRSSGRFSTVLQVLAAATGVGEAAALVDLGDGLDPADALAMGVDARRLLWLRPATLKQALAATEMVLGSGFQLVVLDLGNPPLARGDGASISGGLAGSSPGGDRGSRANAAAAWLRLARAAKAQASALLVSSPYRVSGTAAGVVLRAGRGPALWGQGSPCLLGGIHPRLSLDKGRGCRHGQQESLALHPFGSLPPGSLPPPAEAPFRQEPLREPLREPWEPLQEPLRAPFRHPLPESIAGARVAVRRQRSARG